MTLRTRKRDSNGRIAWNLGANGFSPSKIAFGVPSATLGIFSYVIKYDTESLFNPSRLRFLILPRLMTRARQVVHLDWELARELFRIREITGLVATSCRVFALGT